VSRQDKRVREAGKAVAKMILGNHNYGRIIACRKYTEFCALAIKRAIGCSDAVARAAAMML